MTFVGQSLHSALQNNQRNNGDWGAAPSPRKRDLNDNTRRRRSDRMLYIYKLLIFPAIDALRASHRGFAAESFAVTPEIGVAFNQRSVQNMRRFPEGAMVTRALLVGLEPEIVDYSKSPVSAFGRSWPEATDGRSAEHVRAALAIQTSTCSAIANASSTSMPR
jgi:hypothetical protein